TDQAFASESLRQSPETVRIPHADHSSPSCETSFCSYPAFCYISISIIVSQRKIKFYFDSNLPLQREECVLIYYHCSIHPHTIRKVFTDETAVQRTYQRCT